MNSKIKLLEKCSWRKMKIKFVQADAELRRVMTEMKMLNQKNDLSLEQYQRLEEKRTMHSMRKNLD